MRQLTLA